MNSRVQKNNCQRLLLVFSIIVFMSLIYTRIYAQTDVDPFVEYHIKAAVIKQKSVRQIILGRRSITDSLFIRGESKPGFSGTGNGDIFNYLRFPGFGYTPFDLECKVSPSDLEYPDKKWTLYQVNFPSLGVNDTIASWSNYRRYYPDDRKYSFGLHPYGYTFQYYYLLAVNKKNEIKYISGFIWSHPIAQDFKLRKNKPASYIPFLEIKLFPSQYQSIQFLRKEEGFLVFLLTKREGENIAEYEYFLDPANPDKDGKSKRLTPYETSGGYKPRLSGKINLGFPSFEDKKNYLRDALMKNIYLYRILNLENLDELLNANPSNGRLNPDPTVLDSLLPNYDEYLSEISLIRWDCCYENGKWGCAPMMKRKDILKYRYIFQQLPREPYRALVGWISSYHELEFYKFYKTRQEYLIRRPSKYTEQPGGPGEDWCSWRDTATLARQKREEQWEEERKQAIRAQEEEYEEAQRDWKRKAKKLRKKDPTAIPPPPPLPPPIYPEVETIRSSWSKLWDPSFQTEWVRYDAFYHPEDREKGPITGGDCPFPRPTSQTRPPFYPNPGDYCPPNQAPSPYDAITEPVDYYLLALDPNTREVYFISGKDIYHSKATPLYRAGRSPQEVDESKPWPLEYQLIYLQDRLYQYRVDDLREEHIIFNDEEKMVLEVQGLEDGRPLSLRVTMYKERPEMLEVERL